MNITTYRWSASATGTEHKSASPLSGKAVSEVHRPSPKVLPQITQSAGVLTTSRRAEQQSAKSDQEKLANFDTFRPSPNVLPQTSKSTSVVPRLIKDDEKVESFPVVKPLATKSELKPKAVVRTDSPAKVPIQHTREKVERITTEPLSVSKQDLNDRSKASSGRNSLKKRAYSVSDLKAIHKKFEQAQQDNSLNLLKVTPKNASVKKSLPFERVDRAVSITSVTSSEEAPKMVAPPEMTKSYSFSQMDTENCIATKKLPPIGVLNKSSVTPILDKKDTVFKQHKEDKQYEELYDTNVDDCAENFVGKLEMPMPCRATAEFAQAGISNLQIVSPTPRKVSPEPIVFHNEQSEDVAVPAQGSSSRTDGNWRVRKQLPFKLDMNSYTKHQHRAANVEDQPSYEPETGISERQLPEVIPFVATTQYDECIANSRRRASMPIPDAYLRGAMNRSPAGSDDSSTLDTPKESKKVSFSPTITTFRLDPVEELEDVNHDYFGSIGSNSIISNDEYEFEQSPISHLPPPLESNTSYSRHQRTASAPQSDFGTDDKRDTSAFWKAFSSEMTNAPYIYGSSGRDGRISMLPQPDRPENYYGSNASQRKPPAWVKNSLEGGRPEPSLPAPSPWRQSGLWENLFGRKNGEKM